MGTNLKSASNRTRLMYGLLFTAATSCAADSPSWLVSRYGPVELLVRVKDPDGRVGFAVVHSWEELETSIAAPFRGKGFSINAIELDPTSDGAPWMKPGNGAADVHPDVLEVE